MHIHGCQKIWGIHMPKSENRAISCGTTLGLGKRWNAYSNDLGHLLLFIIVNPSGAWAFSRDFTINLAPQCRPFSRTLKNEKLKAPPFCGPEGTGDTNEWSIRTVILDYF